MITEEKKFLSSNGMSQITYYTFLPEGNPVAILQICHGMAEHLMRYADFAAYMVEKGVIVCGCDHLGHGKSIPEDGAPGYLGDEGKALDVLVADQRLLVLEMRKKYKHLPYILLGHSMGSFVTRRFISEYRDLIDGAIICGTAGPDSPAGVGVVAAKIGGALKGKKKRKQPSTLLAFLAFGNYTKRTGSKDPSSWLSRDPEIVAKYNADPLCGFAFTPTGYRQVFECIKKVNDESWAPSVDKSLSLLVTAGEEDPVGSYGKGPRRVYDMLKDAEIGDVELKMYPGCRHEILNETNRDEVYADFAAFILRVAENARALRTGV